MDWSSQGIVNYIEEKGLNESVKVGCSFRSLFCTVGPAQSPAVFELYHLFVHPADR